MKRDLAAQTDSMKRFETSAGSGGCEMDVQWQLLPRGMTQHLREERAERGHFINFIRLQSPNHY